MDDVWNGEAAAPGDRSRDLADVVGLGEAARVSDINKAAQVKGYSACVKREVGLRVHENRFLASVLGTFEITFEVADRA